MFYSHLLCFPKATAYLWTTLVEVLLPPDCPHCCFGHIFWQSLYHQIKLVSMPSPFHSCVYPSDAWSYVDILRVTHQDCTSFSTGCPTSWEFLTLMLLFHIIREHSFLPLKLKDSNNHWEQQAASRAPESYKLGRKEPELEPEKKHQKPKKTVAFPFFLQWTKWSQTLLNRNSNSQELYRLTQYLQRA